jgi:hypothetical protein
MATDPQFAAVVSVAAAQLTGAAETSLTAPTTATTVLTAGANGTKIEEIVIHAIGASLTQATTAGFVYVFINDGSYRLYDTIPITAVTPSAGTTAPFRVSRTYTNLWIKSGSTLRASNSVVGNQNFLMMLVFGGDY